MKGSDVIVFKMLSERGHLYASFYFAHTLQAHGYTVVYASVKEQEAVITKNGFSFYLVPPDPGIPSGTLISKPIPKIKYGIRTVRREVNKLNQLFITTDFFSKIIKDLNPKALIIDKCCLPQTIQAYTFPVPVCTLETTVSTAKFKGIPSLNSYFVPRFNWLSNLFADFTWYQYLFVKAIEKWVFGSMDESILKIVKAAKYPVDRLDFKRFESLGYLDIPELLVSPEEFDFPHIKNNNQYYIGPSMFSNRKETGCDSDYYERISKIEKGPVVYCAMGTLSWRYKGINKFFSALVEAFTKKPDWSLIICVDDDITRRRLRKKCPHNIHIFKRVPQKELLQKVDLMINHGGLNSITECILSDVPLLIYPGSSALDQVGNSCRVVFHGIGLRGKLQKVNPEEITNKVETLLTTTSYRENVRLMKEKIMRNGNYEKAVHVLESLIQKYSQKEVEKIEAEVV